MENLFLHEKYMYLKMPINNHSSFSIGLVHEAMWGGETKQHGVLNQSMTDYLRVFFGQSASSKLYIGERDNVLGNHLGIWDISYASEKQSRIFRLYFQHPFEDKSGMYQHFLDELKALKIPLKSFLQDIDIFCKKIAKIEKLQLRRHGS